MDLARRIAALAVVVACVAAVIGYQSGRPAAATANPVVFVPSSNVYKHLSPSAKATLADVYWLTTISFLPAGLPRASTLTPMILATWL